MRVIRSRDDRRSVRKGMRDGTLTRILPGVHATEVSPDAICRAIAAADPTAVVLGLGARWLGWRPDLPPSEPLIVASTRRLSSNFLRTVERRVPTEFQQENGMVRFSSPEYTAVDLIPDLGGEVVDDVLRVVGGEGGSQNLRAMWAALDSMPGRRGNRLRRAILRESRDRPWSEAERKVHRLLRDAGITGWQTNVSVRAGGRRHVVDLVFPAERIAVEVDGWEFHQSFTAFTRDRAKTNDLQTAGWVVLRITWAQIEKDLLRWLRPILTARR